MDRFDMAGGADTYTIRLFWRDYVFTRDHRVIQTVLATGFENFAKGPHVKAKLVFIRISIRCPRTFTCHRDNRKVIRNIWRWYLQ
jgi:hypothetical protein